MFIGQNSFFCHAAPGRKYESRTEIKKWILYHNYDRIQTSFYYGERRMRIWAKLFDDNHMIKDYVYEDYSDETRTHKVFNGLDEVCKEFDLPRPIWLDANVKDFKRNSKTRFRQDSFIEEIPYDFLEFYIIEED